MPLCSQTLHISRSRLSPRHIFSFGLDLGGLREQYSSSMSACSREVYHSQFYGTTFHTKVFLHDHSDLVALEYVMGILNAILPIAGDSS
jgi:hypothetical protein